MSKPHLLIEDYAGVTVVTVTDTALLDAHAIEAFGQEVYQLVDKQNKQKLILDFSNVRFLSSQALGVLLTIKKKCEAIKGRFVLCALREELMKVFKITQLDKLFDFYRDDSAALASFNVNVK